MKKNSFILFISLLFITIVLLIVKFYPDYQIFKERSICEKLLADKNYQNAITCYEKLRINDKSLETEYVYAVLLYKNEKFSEAKEILNKIILNNKQDETYKQAQLLNDIILKKEKAQKEKEELERLQKEKEEERIKQQELEKFQKELSEEKEAKNANTSQVDDTRCKTLLLNGDIMNASVCYEKLLKSSNDVNKRFIYANTLFGIYEFDKAANELNKIIADKNAQGAIQTNSITLLNEINKIKQKAKKESNMDDDYYDAGSKYTIWENPKKLTVYINKNDKKYHLLKRAFATWENLVPNLVHFTYVNSENNSNIYAKSSTKQEIMQNPSYENAAGVTDFNIIHNRVTGKTYIKKAVISVSVDDGRYNLPDKVCYVTALHEIAHALGINFHSPNESDIMHPKITNYNLYVGKPTRRDIHTLKEVYRHNN